MSKPKLTEDTLITNEGLTGFKILQLSQNVVLQSYNGTFVWLPQHHVVAVCSKCKRPVQKTHTCGIYATKTLEQLETLGYKYRELCSKENFQCVVRLELWGRVQLCKTGYRAEKAQIKEIWYLCGEASAENFERAAQLEASYQVPVNFEVLSVINLRAEPAEWSRPSRRRAKKRFAN